MQTLEGIDKYFQGKITIVGIGNALKGDDQLGPLLISKLKGKTNARLFDCGQTPENYLQPIINSKPETIIIVDASDMGLQVGKLRIINKEEIQNFSFSTHNSSLALFLSYLEHELPSVKILIIGIQVGQRDFNQPLSPQVEAVLNDLADFFIKNKNKENFSLK